MEGRNVKIVVDEIGKATIEIDGKRVKGVRAISLRSTVGRATILTLELVAYEVTYDGPIDSGQIEVTSGDSIGRCREFARLD
ncbi:MAG: hypothetical protein WA001_02385 [Patescibacteria group bacterium]